MQKSFDDKSIEMLQEVMSRLPPEVSVYLLITVHLAQNDSCLHVHRKQNITLGGASTLDSGFLNQGKMWKQMGKKIINARKTYSGVKKWLPDFSLFFLHICHSTSKNAVSK